MHKKTIDKKCELLAPAGGIKQFIAAVENGADAVYIGGHLFNARINAENFSDKEIQDAIDFAHKRGVKVYVTMNTLVADDELDDAVRYASFLYEAGADALIIQDIGLGKLVKEYMPDLPLHLSTQATVCDLSAVETSARLGFERVVLSRELSFEEICEICENTDVETEVFVHGALCVCYSGQCQLSRYFGGRSGNRGQCAQPCRLPYRSFDENGKLIETLKYPLSPKDICLIDHLDDLAEAGVTSLKIEGRMKSAEYVAVVTAVYRKYLDMYYDKGSYAVSEEDRAALLQIFNRGGFSEDYFNGDPGMDLMSGNIPKHQGTKIGKVVKRVQGTALVDVKLYDKLSLGDGVEIQGKELCGNVVTYYKELKGGLTRIGDIKGSMEHGDPLFRITSKVQLQAARATYDNVTFETGKFRRRLAVDMTFVLDDGKAELTVDAVTGQKAMAACGPFEEDTENPIAKERIETALRKSGNTPFEVRTVTFEGIFDRKIKVSEINDMRRQALSELEKAMIVRRQAAAVPEYVPLEEDRELAAVELYYFGWDDYISGNVPDEAMDLGVPIVHVLPAVEFDRHFDEIPKDDNVIPYISNVSRGAENIYIEENLGSIVEHCRETGIYVGNLSWIQPFRAAGITVFGDYGLNVYNEQTAAAFDSLGMHRCAESLETIDRDQAVFPLMTTEHHQEGTRLISPGKATLKVVSRNFSSQDVIVPELKNGYTDGRRTLSMGKTEYIRIYMV